jgi:hypothetical protein
MTGEAAIRAVMNLVYVVSQVPYTVLTPYEQDALDLAAAEAGDFLADKVGHLDFARMTDEQRSHFLRLIIIGYRRHLRDIVETQPPF